MRKLFTTLFLLTGVAIVHNASAYNGIWQEVTGPVPSTGRQVITPERAVNLSLNTTYLQGQLSALSTDVEYGQVIELPTPAGTFRSFMVWSTPMMEQMLANKYPALRTYTAYAVDDHRVTAKIDMTPGGFHAMVFEGGSTWFIDPYSDRNDGFYTCYYKKDCKRPVGKIMTCSTQDVVDQVGGSALYLTDSGLPNIKLKTNGTLKRTYRLALACTMEYAQAIGGLSATKAQVLAAMVTTMNRVNGVFEKEIAVTMVLVANNDTLINLPGGTDPFSNGNGNAMLGENQGFVTTRIGNANYDIGHVFSTGGGGVAYQGSVCATGDKAKGVTGQPNPIGDGFDIDYVAHEMGHQFGASHTFNASTSNCAGNGANYAAYEPGSGSTIMAYAGICGSANDFQGHSDAYFHAKSLSEISDYIGSSLGGGSCPVTVSTNNTIPTLPSFSQVYTIPYKTPFEITAPEAIDTDHQTLTYCWEQWNRGDFGKDFANTYIKGPIFRSYNPDTGRTRVFVHLDSLLRNHTYYIGEKLPDTPRYLTFKCTVRDVFNGIGSFNFPDDTIHLNVVNTAGPFKVTSPIIPVSWMGSSMQTITWDVAGTNTGAVSCANVDILLSVDHGHTYPYVLTTATANDGSEVVLLPNIQATFSARIKVKGSGNVFFNLNPIDFTINFDPNGVSTVPWADAVNVFPVPANDQITIRNDHGGELALVFTNAIGQKIWTGTMGQQTSVPVSRWAKGVYYLQITDKQAGGRVVKTVVIN
jgi:hypothetical protein